MWLGNRQDTVFGILEYNKIIPGLMTVLNRKILDIKLYTKIL